jgi:hypothetical protein
MGKTAGRSPPDIPAGLQSAPVPAPAGVVDLNHIVLSIHDVRANAALKYPVNG